MGYMGKVSFSDIYKKLSLFLRKERLEQHKCFDVTEETKSIIFTPWTQSTTIIDLQTFIALSDNRIIDI